MLRSWKLVMRRGNYQTLTLLLFEGNLTKIYEDTVKYPAVISNYAI